MLWPCVCLCLCLSLSVTSRCSTKTAKHRITQTTPHDGPGTLVFWCRRSPRDRPQRGAKGRWGGLKSVNLDIIVFIGLSVHVSVCACVHTYVCPCRGRYSPTSLPPTSIYIIPLPLPLSSTLDSRPLGLLSVHSSS